MTRSESIRVKALFLDIGGVLLTNGWDRHMRRRAAEKFGLDHEDMDERHHLTFDTYEEGKLSLDEYLSRVVFHQDRPFSREDFKAFMFAQSQPFPEMIHLFKRLKIRYGLKLAAVSNEGRELTIHRIEKFKLGELIDFFISSCFVHYRKPDADLYRLAIDCSQIPANQSIYIDDRAMFVEVAMQLGLEGIHHKDYDSTRDALGERGLSDV
jgi:putative hydrolase of the HAD superfamily